MRKLLPFLFIIVAVVAMACSSTTEPQVSNEPTSVPTQATEAASQSPSTSSEPAPTTTSQQASAVPLVDAPSGGVFRRLWADPPTLDPHLTSDTTSAGIVVEIFSGLVVLNTDLQLVPDLAERWEISEDGLVYTFFIRPEAKFHDGKKVTANDFKWSLERAADPKTASPVADTYLNDIVGVAAYIDGQASEITGVQVIDDLTLQITIDAPKAYFLAKLTYPTAYVLDRENVEAGGRSWTDNPNGTGPFKLKEYKIGERLILERNDNYYRELAHLDTIFMNLAGGQSMAMYENDEIDITGVSLFDLERVQDPNEPLNKELVVAPPNFSISYIGFNTSMPPFDDVKFRQALNHAVDKELIAREVLSDLVVPAFGILPPGFPAFNDNLVGLRNDPKLARQLLSETPYVDFLKNIASNSSVSGEVQRLLSESPFAGTGNTPRIVITVPGTGGTIGLDLEVVIEMWRQVLGVEVEIQQVEWATYLQDLNRSKFQAFAGLGWEADYPDPQDFLDILFHT
ncbi:MAG: peptide ABC transporter substrate-binding protein, partial [Chloroflexi bacterium]|nr:peptide ABC transporter substrate-binding protein [Chloroflexota bacterium]